MLCDDGGNEVLELQEQTQGSNEANGSCVTFSKWFTFPGPLWLERDGAGRGPWSL